VKRSVKGTTRSAAAEPRVSPAFERVAAALTLEGCVDDAAASSRGFGSAALKVDGKIFAMPVKGALVVKLPASRVSSLVESGIGTQYDPGHGRLMKEWVVLQGAESRWLEFAREAREFVTADSRQRKRSGR
jgi:hypothetical protein